MNFIRAAVFEFEDLQDGPAHDDYVSLKGAGREYGRLDAYPAKASQVPDAETGHASLELHGLNIAQVRAVLRALKECR